MTNLSRNEEMEMRKYEARHFGDGHYRVGNGIFQFRCTSKADATYLRDALNSLTNEQHLDALKGKQHAV